MKKKFYYSLLLNVALISLFSSSYAQRTYISLNGTWQITKTDTLSKIPTNFLSKIPVPGLVDMAVPALEEPYKEPLDKDIGHPYANNYGNRSYMYNNSLYWYKRSFTLNNRKDEVVKLKLNKSMYHTYIYLNGKKIGENYYSFTPTILDIKPYLNESGKPNELIIAVGSRNNIPETICKGDDPEKVLFAPGIYDDVNIIMSGISYISNVQIAPDIDAKKIRVVAEIENNKNDKFFNLNYIVRELKSKRIVAKGVVPQQQLINGKQTKADFYVAIPKTQLWSPENPFLYTLELNTGSDNLVTRFGMRSFKSDKENGVVLLNNKPYYMRGTNIAIFRFFEDAERGNLPWDNKWVTKLHKRFKEMHWNSFRNTIGFPPERWYEIADSLGFLIQDEYPLWKQKGSKELTSDNLAKEYTTWMRERWNHPSVVIWDAQNESVFDAIAPAINQVRALDLSNRPWENGYMRPGDNDVMESHPYLFYKFFNAYDMNKTKTKTVADEYFNPNDKKEDKDFLSLMATPHIPDNSWVNKSKDADRKTAKYPNIINEYGWFWLNRDGSPTTLDAGIYKNLFPEADTPEKRFEVYAKIIGMKTEFWRAHRKAAGVLYFCALSYSRSQLPRGQTSDNWIDVKNLVFEPNFKRIMKAAFSPVGIMIDYWKDKAEAGAEVKIPVIQINDTYEKWEGKLIITLLKDEKEILKQKLSVKVEPLGKEIHNSTIKLSTEKGKYKLVAEIIYKGESVKSIREFVIN